LALQKLTADVCLQHIVDKTSLISIHSSCLSNWLLLIVNVKPLSILVIVTVAVIY